MLSPFERTGPRTQHGQVGLALRKLLRRPDGIPRSFRRRLSTVLLTLVLAITPTAMISSSAQAACQGAGTVYYEFSNAAPSRKMTNLRSAWVTYSGTIGYSSSTTATVSASMTATVAAEAGVVFAKASASLGVTVGASWSKAGTWNYTANVTRRAGQKARLVMYHETRRFTVKKKRISGSTCLPVTVYTETVNAPRTAGSNVWALEWAAA